MELLKRLVIVHPQSAVLAKFLAWFLLIILAMAYCLEISFSKFLVVPVYCDNKKK